MDENEEKLFEQRWGLKGDSFCIYDPYYCRTVFDDEQQQITHPIGRGRSGSVGSALELPITSGKINVTSIPTTEPFSSITTPESPPKEIFLEQSPKNETPLSTSSSQTPKRGHRRTHSEQLRGSNSVLDAVPPSTPPQQRTRHRSNTEAETRVSDNTIQKVKTFKTYLEEFYWELFTYIHSRCLREQKFSQTLKQKKQRRHIEVETLTREHRKKETLLLRTRRLCGRLTDFHFLKLIGKGAYGEVFLCRRASTGELLALKKLSKTKLHVKNQIAHVKTEQDVLSADASSQWLVHLLYAFQDSENIYFAMEFIPGGDLRSFCEKEHDLSERDAKFYSAEMFSAVDALHKLGYIHRDLKPDNFLIDKEGHLKLADFGLSKKGVNESYGEPFQGQMPSVKLFTPNAIIRREAYRRTRTKVYSMVGSPDYMAVELLRGKGYNFESDWWSLGCILYEILCGFPPFCADTPHEVFSNVMNPALDDGEPLISVLAWDLITKLITEPESRLGVKGIDEIKKHPFFAEVDWLNIKSQWCPPFIPKLENEEDTKYFDRAEPLNHAEMGNMLLVSSTAEPGQTFLEKLHNIPKADVNFDEINFSKAIFERERSLSNSSDDDPMIRSPREKRESPKKSPRSVGKASGAGMLGRMLRKVSSIESLSHFVKVSSRGSKVDKKSDKPVVNPFPLSLDNLSLHDWKVFCTGAVRITLSKDTVVMREGDYNRFLYRIRRGSVRIEKRTIQPPDPEAKNPISKSHSTDSTGTNNDDQQLSGYSIVLTRLERNQVFGEMSFVEDSWVFDVHVSKSHMDSMDEPSSLGGNVSASVIVDSDEAEFYRIDRSFAFYLFRHDKSLFARFYKIVAIMLAERDKNLPLRRFIDSMEQTAKSSPTIQISSPSSSKSSPTQSPRVSVNLANSEKDQWLGADKPNAHGSGSLVDSNTSNTSTQSVTSSDNDSESIYSLSNSSFLTSTNDRKEQDGLKEKKKKEKKSKSSKLRESSDSLRKASKKTKAEKDEIVEKTSDKETKKAKKSKDTKSDRDERKHKRGSLRRQKSDTDLRKSHDDKSHEKEYKSDKKLRSSKTELHEKGEEEKAYKSDKELRTSKTELQKEEKAYKSDKELRTLKKQLHEEVKAYKSVKELRRSKTELHEKGEKEKPKSEKALRKSQSDLRKSDKKVKDSPRLRRKKSEPEMPNDKKNRSDSDYNKSDKENKSDRELRDSDKSDRDIRKSDREDSDKSSPKEDDHPKGFLSLRSLRRRSLEKPLSAFHKIYHLQNNSDSSLLDSVSSKLNLEHNKKQNTPRTLVHSNTWDISSSNNNALLPDIIKHPPSTKRITFNSLPEFNEDNKPKEKPKKGHNRSKSYSSPLSSQETIETISDVEESKKAPSKKDEVVIVEITSEDTKEQDRKVRKQNARFRRRFKLPSGEFVVLKYQCVYSREKHRFHGKLYLGKNHLCFYSKIFGFRKKKVIKFKHIKTITRMEGEICVTSDGKQYLFSEFPDPRSVSEVYDMLERIHQNNLQSITPHLEGAYQSTDEYSSLSEWDRTSEHEDLVSPRLRSLSEAEQKELNRSNDNNNTPSRSDTSTDTPIKGLARTFSRKSSLDQKLIGGPSTFNNTRIWEEEELTVALTLNQDEWDLILNGAEFLTYIKDEVIVKQGDIPHRIYQIASGMCRIEITKDNKQQIIGTLATSEMFGEISVLTEVGPATMSIVVDTTNVDVYAIPREYINELFLKHPGLEGKFYKFIALVLARRIRQRELEEQFRLSVVKDRVFLTHLA